MSTNIRFPVARKLTWPSDFPENEKDCCSKRYMISLVTSITTLDAIFFKGEELFEEWSQIVFSHLIQDDKLYDNYEFKVWHLVDWILFLQRKKEALYLKAKAIHEQ